MTYYNSKQKQLDDFRVGDKSLNGFERNLLQINEGGKFYDIGWVAGCDSVLDSRGASAGDIDNDGDEDIVISSLTHTRVYRNLTGNRNNWIKVRLKGHPGRDIIGARIVVKSQVGTQIREISCGSAYFSQGPETAVFGLGRSNAPVTVEVHWPPVRQPNGEIKRDITRREAVSVRRELVIARP